MSGRTLKIRCYLCGNMTKYDFFKDDGSPKLCRACNKNIATPKSGFFGNNGVSISGIEDNKDYYLNDWYDYFECTRP